MFILYEVVYTFRFLSCIRPDVLVDFLEISMLKIERFLSVNSSVSRTSRGPLKCLCKPLLGLDLNPRAMISTLMDVTEVYSQRHLYVLTYMKHYLFFFKPNLVFAYTSPTFNNIPFLQVYEQQEQFISPTTYIVK